MVPVKRYRMIILPKEKVKASVINPRFLIIFGKPKSGKTTVISALEDNLIIDLEGGTEFYDAMAVQARTIKDLGEIANALEAEKKANNGKNPYKYITIDNGTILEDIAKTYALRLYQALPVAKDSKTGKIFDGDILTLPKGAGYYYLREAFDKIIAMFRNLCDTFILVAHVKDKLVDKNGQEMSEMAIDLTGKMERLTAGDADAVGYLSRVENRTLLNFNGKGNIICEARVDHLRGREFVIATSDEHNNVTVDWSKIFKED